MIQSTNQSEIVLYTTIDGKVKIDTVFQDKTIWLTQKKMAELFDVQRPAITKHLNNVFESDELDEKVVSSILEHTTRHSAIEGKTQMKIYYTDLQQNRAKIKKMYLSYGAIMSSINKKPSSSPSFHVQEYRIYLQFRAKA